MSEADASRHRALAGRAPLDQSGPHVLCLAPVDDATEAAFRHAFEIAGRDGVVVVYDRREESWRPDLDALLLDADDECFASVAEIGRARRVAETADTDLAVWRSITPALGTGMVEAVQVAEITDIVVPADGHTDATSDRVLGDESLASAVAELLRKPVVTDAGTTPTMHTVDVDT
jgi:hypothetical protein